jgi:hypothetical protein
VHALLLDEHARRALRGLRADAALHRADLSTRTTGARHSAHHVGGASGGVGGVGGGSGGSGRREREAKRIVARARVSVQRCHTTRRHALPAKCPARAPAAPPPPSQSSRQKVPIRPALPSFSCTGLWRLLSALAMQPAPSQSVLVTDGRALGPRRALSAARVDSCYSVARHSH